MPRKRTRIISRKTARAAKATVPVAQTLPNLDLDEEYIRSQMPVLQRKENESDTDFLFRIIYEKSRLCYTFTDPESGIPWIRHEDIEDKGNGLFVIRFRCPTQFMHHIHFGCMADAVCKELNSTLNVFHSTKEEYGIPYADCVWVIQKDSKESERPDNEEDEEGNQDNFDSLEEFPDNFKDESTAEEILSRFNEAIENFL